MDDELRDDERELEHFGGSLDSMSDDDAESLEGEEVEPEEEEADDYDEPI